MPENPNDRPRPGHEIVAVPEPVGNDFFARKCTRLEAQITSLKEVSSIRQNLLDIRSREVKNLIEKLKLFEEAIGAERQYRESLSTRMKVAEDNLSELKSNYEEKINKLARELEKADSDYQKRTDELNDSELRNIDLNNRVEEYAKLIHEHEKNVKQLKEELRVVAERNRAFSYQMNLLNTLFNETEGTPIDFERIRAIGDIVRESQNMPRISPPSVLTEDGASTSDSGRDSDGSKNSSIDFDHIIDQIETERPTADIPGEESCYKQVSTMHGTQLVLSVSQTFIKLKDLILEKKSLQREIDSLKNLNSKLEVKVDKQERRLFLVTSELNKTWNLVAKLKVQHNKLHNSEAVLKYELHEKRKLLEKLKEELSFSRQQWAQARQKNRESEILCQSMRADFAKRRQASSLESGAFSDASASESPCSFSNEDNEQDEDEEPEIQLAMQNSEEEEDDVEDIEDEEDETEALQVDDFEMEIVPLEELVSDFVEDVEAVTAADDSVMEQGDVEEAVFGNPNRASRLRRLEDAGRVLYSRLMATNVQSSALASRLAQLHNHYGSHDLPVQGIAEPYEYDETTVNTESSTDPAYASVHNNNTAADDTEVDSQFEDVAPNLRNSQALTGSVEMLHEDLLAETEEVTHSQIQEVAGTSSHQTPALSGSSVVATSDLTPLSGHEEFYTDSDEGRDSSGVSSPDPNSLSRLIIQQVPKRLEMLKQQNSTMKNKEQLLMDEVKQQKELLETLEQEKSQLAEAFETSIKSRDEEIRTLNDKINELISSTSRDKENMAAFVKAYVEEKSGGTPTQTPQDNRKCHGCQRQFSIFTRRKHKCSVCSNKFCQDCCILVDGCHRTTGVKRMCTCCHDRRILLETAAKIFTDSTLK